jgi:hypothetical protein
MTLSFCIQEWRDMVLDSIDIQGRTLLLTATARDHPAILSWRCVALAPGARGQVSSGQMRLS